MIPKAMWREMGEILPMGWPTTLAKHSLTADGAILRLDQMLSVAKVTAFQLRRAFGGS